MKRYRMGTQNEFPLQTGKVVGIGELELALYRLSNGEFRALENRCPHKGGPLSEGIVSGTYVYCPLHDWKVCVTDGRVQAPDFGCVRTYGVEVVGEEVFILVPEDALVSK